MIQKYTTAKSCPRMQGFIIRLVNKTQDSIPIRWYLVSTVPGVERCFWSIVEESQSGALICGVPNASLVAVAHRHLQLLNDQLRWVSQFPANKYSGDLNYRLVWCSRVMRPFVWGRFHKLFATYCALRPTFEKLFTGVEVGRGRRRRAQMDGAISMIFARALGVNKVYEIDPWSSHFHKTPLNIQASSLFYLTHLLYLYH